MGYACATVFLFFALHTKNNKYQFKFKNQLY